MLALPSRMTLPKLPFSLPWVPHSNSAATKGGASGGKAGRLNLPTLQRRPEQWRSLLVHAADLQSEIDSLQPRPSLTGRWKKCSKASDPMDEACAMVELPWLLKKAVLVLNTLELEDSDSYFKTNLKAGGVMDVIEKYPWTGEAVEHPRRDKRRGTHTAFVERTERGPCITASWQDPFGGDCTDTFELSADGSTLTQYTDMTIRSSGRHAAYKTVFHRVHMQ
ncbi:hypothetical protein ACK3TF_003712 [Chlorella vulgaris]